MAYSRHMMLWILWCVLAPPGFAADQQDRRGRLEPGLVVETGSRMGTCDVLTFTADGNHLLATGDDKVVRVWPVTPDGINPKDVRTLRWSIWHEQRGHIYALAFDPTGHRIAIAGKGVMTGLVTVLDIESGQVQKSLTDPNGNDEVIRALCFSPSGNEVAIGTEDGTIWIWKLDGEESTVHRLGVPPEKRSANRVRFLRFESESGLISVAEDGRALQWDLSRPGASPVERFRFFNDRKESPALYRVVATPDGRMLAAAANTLPMIELRETDGSAPAKRIVLSKPLSFPRRTARSLAFDFAGHRLAVGIRESHRNDLFYGSDDAIEIYDVRNNPLVPKTGPRCSFHAEGLAFHPDGKRLAIAGGDDQEVSLWRIGSDTNQVQVMRGPGRSLWSVGISSDNRYIGFRDQRATQPQVNVRGSGPWRVFNLNTRSFRPVGVEFKPVDPIESTGGWKVDVPSDDVSAWSAVAPNGSKYRLGLDDSSGGVPLCYTFLNANEKSPIRLAVGQYYGSVSLFEFDSQKPRGLVTRADGNFVRPVKIFTAHQGEVMAIAPRDDQQWLVTASRDQTIAALSLIDWPIGNELGASFVAHGGKVYVERVDGGSPAWEAGLTEGDEIRLLAFDGKPKPIFNRTKQYGGPAGTPEECLERLRDVVPGKEFYFLLKRPGQEDLVPALTKVYRRPQWRFFPTTDREYVLWLWRSYHYDTSTNGDFLVGWHVNQGMKQKPDFYPAEKMRAIYHRPALVYNLLWNPRVETEIRSLVKMRPPRVSIDLAARGSRSGDNSITATISARSIDPTHPDQDLANAELWIEDYRFDSWKASGKSFAQTVTIPASALRSGTNQLTFQCTNAAGASDEIAIKVPGVERAELPDLYGLVVGVEKYENARGPEGRPKDLKHTVKDANAISKAWLRQSGKRYRHAEVTPLLDGDATRDAILLQLERLRKRVRADDMLVLFLGGHGFDQPRKGEKQSSDRFVFCCPDFDIARPDQTGITSEVLFAELAKLRCRKLVLLDVCHAGLVAANPVRGLTPGGKGPTILASCDKNEAAIEDDFLEHGLFTFALVEALGRDFERADRDRDQKLDADELFTYSETRLPELLKKLSRAQIQNPTRFPKQPDPFPLAEK